MCRKSLQQFAATSECRSKYSAAHPEIPNAMTFTGILWTRLTFTLFVLLSVMRATASDDEAAIGEAVIRGRAGDSDIVITT